MVSPIRQMAQMVAQAEEVDIIRSEVLEIRPLKHHHRETTVGTAKGIIQRLFRLAAAGALVALERLPLRAMAAMAALAQVQL